MFTGDIAVNNEKLQIALWRKTEYGKESFTIQITKEENTSSS